MRMKWHPDQMLDRVGGGQFGAAQQHLPREQGTVERAPTERLTAARGRGLR